MVVDKRTAKLAFAQRLGEALTAAGVLDDQNRRRWVSRTFGVSVESARKWLVGEVMPDTARLEGIARQLGVTPNWLLSGDSQVNEPVAPYYVTWQTRPEHAHLADALDHAYRLGTLTPALSAGLASMLETINRTTADRAR